MRSGDISSLSQLSGEKKGPVLIFVCMDEKMGGGPFLNACTHIAALVLNSPSLFVQLISVAVVFSPSRHSKVV